MMIGPEGYYEEYLKGKDADGVLRKIRSLKREINSLKRTMEHPDYKDVSHIHPSEETQLWCTRRYLARAKQALEEVGGVYQPTPSEIRVEDFDKNLQNIEKITLHIGSFFGGWCTYTVRLDDHLHFWVENTEAPTPTNFDIPEDYPMTKEEFLEALGELHIGEWRRNYDTLRFGYEVCDGTQWELHIYFSNGHKPVKIYGDNAYPYNFDSVLELFEIEK
jgi:hypothetical protein